MIPLSKSSGSRSNRSPGARRLGCGLAAVAFACILAAPAFGEPVEFVEIPGERLEALKQAGTPEAWKSLMPEAKEYLYKRVGGRDLPLYFFPAGRSGDMPPATLVLLTGGAFRDGRPTGFYRQALDYSRRGLSVVLPKYRGTEADGVQIIDSLRDARDAVAWVRDHAAELGVHPGRILVGGSSAGSLSALSLATIDSLHHEIGHRKGVPDGLLLYDLGGGGATAPVEGDPLLGPEPPGRWSWFTEERFGADPKSLSPLHHLHENLPPAAIFIGGRENPRTLHATWLLWNRAQEKGAKWDLHLYADMPHAGMVNSATWQPQVYQSVVETTLRFARRNGFLE